MKKKELEACRVPIIMLYWISKIYIAYRREIYNIGRVGKEMVALIKEDDWIFLCGKKVSKKGVLINIVGLNQIVIGKVLDGSGLGEMEDYGRWYISCDFFCCLFKLLLNYSFCV